MASWVASARPTSPQASFLDHFVQMFLNELFCEEFTGSIGVDERGWGKMPQTLKISPRAGELPLESELIDLNRLLDCYENAHPDPTIRAQQVRFGTSGHRGSSLRYSFNKDHIIAITQAICNYRSNEDITGPVFIGYDTHALSFSAYQTAIEVMASNGVFVLRSSDNECTPTPVISYSIIHYNLGRHSRLADGIVVTPSHNPPDEGGIKYNSTHGGPAQAYATRWIETEANRLLREGVGKISKMSWERALQAESVSSFDYITPYVADLVNVVDLYQIHQSHLSLGVDPMGGAGIHYWERIADLYNLKLTLTNEKLDPRFSFVPLDWDGKIRMDPTSPYAMQPLIGRMADFNISIACDTDHDRHGVVSPVRGLLSANHYLSSAAFYLWSNRKGWSKKLSLGKTIVTTEILDRVANFFGTTVFEVPVGFKWFEDALYHEEMGMAAEESGGATILRLNGKVWTTDKDGIVLGLLAAEMTAQLGYDPGQLYHELEERLGHSFDQRVDSAASRPEMLRLQEISLQEVAGQELAGEKVDLIETRAHGDLQPIGGIKFKANSGWMAIRPSGTENLYKIYAESFRSRRHLSELLESGRTIVQRLFQE